MVGNGITAFLNKLKAEPIRWTEVSGIVFVFLSAIIPLWITAEVLGYKESFGLFGSGGIWPLIGFLFIVLSVAQALIHLDLIPQLSPIVNMYKSLPFSQFYYPGFVCLMWLLYMIFSVGNMSHSAYGGVYYGFSFWLCMLGAILLLLVPVMKLIKKENYYA